MSTRIASLALVTLFAGLTTLVGCASDASPDAQAADDEAAATSASHPLSKDLLCAAVKEASDDSTDPISAKLKEVQQSSLKGDALKDFKSFQKNMLPDYPSQAFDLPVTLDGKTYTFLMVVENNDGGQYIGVYRTDGSTIATVANSESENGDWGPAPADTCPL